MEIKSSIDKIVPIDSMRNLKLHIDKTTIQYENGYTPTILIEIYAMAGFRHRQTSFLDASDTIGFTLLNLLPNKHEANLRNIKITNQEYLGRGIGSAMLKVAEDLSMEYGCDRIEGLFRPDTNTRVKKEDVENFYKKNGYFLYFDDEADYGWTVAKNLNPQNHIDEDPTK